MQESERHYTIEELAELVDLPVRTIRYYISENLLPGPEGRGRATIYSEEHLLKLRLIKLLSRQHVPLAEMRSMLAHISLSEVRALLNEEEQRIRQQEQAGREFSPEDYIAGLLNNARAARQNAGLPTPAVSPGQQVVREVPSPYAPAPAPIPGPSRSPASPAPPMPGPGGPPQDLWRRWELAPGIELHVRTDAEQRHRSLLERLFRAAGKVYHHLINNI